MTELEREALLGTCLEDFRDRSLRGESPHVRDYVDRLDGMQTEFIELLELDSKLEDLLEPPADEIFPRAFGEYQLLRELGRGATGSCTTPPIRDKTSRSRSRSFGRRSSRIPNPSSGSAARRTLAAPCATST